VPRTNHSLTTQKTANKIANTGKCQRYCRESIIVQYKKVQLHCGSKKGATFIFAITLANVDRF